MISGHLGRDISELVPYPEGDNVTYIGKKCWTLRVPVDLSDRPITYSTSHPGIPRSSRLTFLMHHQGDDQEPLVKTTNYLSSVLSQTASQAGVTFCLPTSALSTMISQNQPIKFIHFFDWYMTCSAIFITLMPSF
jgi:hypothetical protein